MFFSRSLCYRTTCSLFFFFLNGQAGPFQQASQLLNGELTRKSRPKRDTYKGSRRFVCKQARQKDTFVRPFSSCRVRLFQAFCLHLPAFPVFVVVGMEV